jgi:hypothetical protein
MMGGVGINMRRAMAETSRDVEMLGMHMAKYKSQHGVVHADNRGRVVVPTVAVLALGYMMREEKGRKRRRTGRRTDR